ncbi:MAG: hypothetical protein LCH61_15800 [Proteobacteria bacterium]|jgi:hypothetical protein|nr:hypothetical protein [Pseudomonadota bacterium]
MKSLRIGLKQADRLASMPTDDRRAFISEGLTIIYTSAISFWEGARLLSSRTREADVLEEYATEEAAKILILLDVFRAPPARHGDVLRQQLKRFYSHHDRLIYAEAVKWKPMHRAQLQEYLDHTRRSHTLDGPAGEFILPNGPVFERERKLYADVIAYEDKAIHWNDPVGPGAAMGTLPFFDHPPAIVSLIISMSRIGLLTVEGLKAIEETWGKVDFMDTDGAVLARDLSHQTLIELEKSGKIPQDAQPNDVWQVKDAWPFPMWSMDLKKLDVPLAEMEEERDRGRWSEYSDPGY